MRKIILSLALVLSYGNYQPGSASAAVSSQGILDYQAGRYRQAVVNLARESGAQPRNVMVHYYLANALVKCGDHYQAAEEYRIAYMLDPKGAVSSYCATALKGYKKSVPSLDDIRFFYETIDGGTAFDAATRAHKEGKNQVVAKDPALKQASSLIRRQVSYEKAKNQSIGDSNASAMLKNGDYESRQVESWARSEIDRLWAPQLHPTDPRMLDPTYLEMREKQIRSAAKEEQEQIRREALARADRYRRTSEMRQHSLDQVADNLERQMTEKPRNGGVRLLADGTDLYVRRYASTSANQCAPEVHSAVARIYGQRADAQSMGQSGDSCDYCGKTEVHTHSVRGKVLN